MTTINTCRDCRLKFITHSELQDHLALHRYDSIHTNRDDTIRHEIKLRAGKIKEMMVNNKK